MKVIDIYNYIDKIAPFNTCDNFDNVGLLVGDMYADITGVLLSTDITNEVINEAIEKDCNLIVTHHPVIFDPLKRVNKGSIVYRLIESEIAVISAHTNLDMAKGGVSDMMLELMGYESSKVFEVLGERDGKEYGYGKIVKLDEPASVEEFVEMVKGAFDVHTVRYTDGGAPIRRFAVCSGAGGANTLLAVERNCDAYITGDCKHNNFIDAKNLGLTLIDAGHYYTERIFAPILCKKLSREFPELNFTVSETDTDPVKYL